MTPTEPESGPRPEAEAAELILHWQGMEQTALQAPANVAFAELAHRTWVMLRALLDQVQTLRKERESILLESDIAAWLRRCASTLDPTQEQK